MSKKQIAILISGRGSNLQCLIDASTKEDYPAEIALVVSNRPNAAGLERARKAGIPTQVIDHRDFGSKEVKYDDGRAEFESALEAALEAASVEFVCLAGFMRLFTADFVTKWRGRMLNIHPSLLPAFKGLSVHERTIDSGVKIAGCTVHFVSAEMDAGPIVGQAAVSVLPGDTPKDLANRILVEEHKLYPACVKLLAEGKARLTSGNTVTLSEDVCTQSVLRNPSVD